MAALPRPNVYDVGDRIRLRGVFTNLAGVDTDPTTIVCKYQDPGGVETTVTYPTSIVKVSTGRYYLDIDIDEAGTWYYRWNGTGDVVAAGEQSFIARTTVF